MSSTSPVNRPSSLEKLSWKAATAIAIIHKISLFALPLIALASACLAVYLGFAHGLVFAALPTPVIGGAILLFGINIGQIIMRVALHPGPDPSSKYSPRNRDFTRDYITTKDGITLPLLIYTNTKAKGTVIIWHGNAESANLKSRSSLAAYYNSLHLNIIIPTYRGYTQSMYDYPQILKEAKTKNKGKDSPRFGKRATIHQEKQAYYDVQAVATFAAKFNKNVICHGYSLGGTYAAIYARYFKAKVTILDRTFPSYTQVASHMSHLPKWLIYLMVRTSYLPGKVGQFSTNGFDTLKQLKGIDFSSQKVLFIRHVQDPMMTAVKTMAKKAFTMWAQNTNEKINDLKNKYLITYSNRNAKNGHNDQSLYSDTDTRDKISVVLKQEKLI